MGSSANRTAGRVMRARATATRCCWPPESSAGRCVRRSCRPTASMTVRRQASSALAAGERERQDDVLVGGQRGEQVEALEDEADLVAAQLRELLLLEPGDLDAVDADPAAGGLVEAGEDVHERALAGAGRAHDGREPALGDVDVDVAQGVHGGVALAVGAREAARRDDGAAGAALGEERLAGELVLEPGERLARLVVSFALGNGGGPHDVSSWVTCLRERLRPGSVRANRPSGGEWASAAEGYSGAAAGHHGGRLRLLPDPGAVTRWGSRRDAPPAGRRRPSLRASRRRYPGGGSASGPEGLRPPALRPRERLAAAPGAFRAGNGTSRTASGPSAPRRAAPRSRASDGDAVGRHLGDHRRLAADAHAHGAAHAGRSGRTGPAELVGPGRPAAPAPAGTSSIAHGSTTTPILPSARAGVATRPAGSRADLRHARRPRAPSPAKQVPAGEGRHERRRRRAARGRPPCRPGRACPRR